MLTVFYYYFSMVGKAPIVKMVVFHWFYKQNNPRQSSGEAPAIVETVIFHWFYKQANLRRSSDEALAILKMVVFWHWFGIVLALF